MRTRSIMKKKPLKRKRKNQFIGKEVRFIDYKNVELLEKFINAHGKILPARATGLTARQQRQMSLAIKRARHMALLPYTKERIRR